MQRGNDRPGSSRAGQTLLLLVEDVVDGIPDGLDLLRVFVRDADVELVLEFHDQFDGVEGVRAEVIDERGLRLDLFTAGAELATDDVDDLFFYFFVGESHVFRPT